MRLLKVWSRIVPGADYRQLESVDGGILSQTIMPLLQLLLFLLHDATAGQWREQAGAGWNGREATWVHITRYSLTGAVCEQWPI